MINGGFFYWAFGKMVIFIVIREKKFFRNAWSGLANITVVSDKRIVRSHNKRFLV